MDQESLFWANTQALKSPRIREDPVLRYLPDMINDPASQLWSALPELGALCDSLMENSQAYFLGRQSVDAALDRTVEYWNQVIGEGQQHVRVVAYSARSVFPGTCSNPPFGQSTSVQGLLLRS